MKKTLLVIFLIAAGFSIAAFFIAHNPFEKKEGEITIGELAEQSRRNVPGATKDGVSENFNPSIAPAIYEGTLLVSVPDNDQRLIREGGSELPFATYVPTKIPQGFSLRPTSISHGTENNITLFHTFFSHANGDSVVIDQYRISDYLTATKQTLAEFTSGGKAVQIGEKKIYVSDIGAKTSGRFQYYQTVTIILDPVMIRVEYIGEKKLSESDLVALAASFTQ